MKRNVLFIVSLALILVFSYVNIVYFGYADRNRCSPVVNQLIHVLFLTLTGLLGYLNWKGGEKWLNWLWITLYAIVFAGVGCLLLAYMITGGHINPLFKLIIVGLRNRFTEPVPFLVFYILQKIAARFSEPGKDSQQ